MPNEHTFTLRAQWLGVSTRSGNGSANCVEAGPVLDGSGRFAVRDSKDRTGPTLLFPAADWTTFLSSLPSPPA
ncbi:DUF397 domain-containing protein [Micromonospora yangpuensis]|uniref:DUF397 domain-containing protein n=1 Tax=Micromonospora yangpuensis TaxID=683228 RepID=UPI001FD58B84|nr:DUF397 domain-containing protein [Micromonospora yangpuensis]